MGNSISTPKTKIKNQVLTDDFQPSQNFYKSDLILQHYLKENLSKEAFSFMKDKLEILGSKAAIEMDSLSIQADKNGPQLVKRDSFGNTINHIEFHPSYWSLMEIAVESQMFTVKWEPSLRSKFIKETHRLGFSAGYLYAMSECGQYCPLCMTDGVARLLDLFGEKEDKDRLLKQIATKDPNEFYTGAMYLTEKSGGSDVGANLTKASRVKENDFLLNGEKWFCSNANADIIFALGRSEENVTGTKGLSLFLVEKHLKNGERNPIDIVRIKEKLGVRSMASAECLLTDTKAKLVGEEFKGFKMMAEMLNLSRLYNSVAALSCSRRALIEVYQYLNHRNLFRKNALEHALIRSKFTELGSLNVAGFYLTWRTIKALDNADNGNEKEKQLARFLTPMVKKWTAEKGVYIVRESMELMGGMGYIEDTIMPKLMRDVMVLPIWEGSGNIIILDMLRAMVKSEGFTIMCEEIETIASKNNEYGVWVFKKLEKIRNLSQEISSLDQDTIEMTGKQMLEELTTLYQVALMMDACDDTSKKWILPALDFFSAKNDEELKPRKPISKEEVENLIAWEF